MPSWNETVGQGARVDTYTSPNDDGTCDGGEDGTVIRVDPGGVLNTATSAAVGTIVGAVVTRVMFNDDGA